MNKKVTLSITALTLALCVNAQTNYLPNKLKFADTNNDNTISKDELDFAVEKDLADTTRHNRDNTLQLVLFYQNYNSVSVAGMPATKDSAAMVNATAPAKLPFTFSGYADCNYFKNLNNPKSGSNLGKSGFERAFDQSENMFQLGLVQTKFGFTTKKAEAVVDLTFGPHADLGNYGNAYGSNGLIKGTTALAIKQAYVSYKPTDKWAITAGQFGTHIGMEVIESSINYNYSLSNLFNNGPFYHLGLKATYAPTGVIAITAGIVNNWDAIYDNNRFKTIMGQIAITPASKKVSVYINYLGGKEDFLRDTTLAANISYYQKDTVGSFKQMIDLVGNFQITEKLYVGVNAALGFKSKMPDTSDTTGKKTKTENWGGVALYINYQLHRCVGLGIRAELFDNTSGLQYIGKTDVTSYTATLPIKLNGDNILFKPEFRIDMYKKREFTGDAKDDIQQFTDSKGYNTKSSQITIGAALIYKF